MGERTDDVTGKEKNGAHGKGSDRESGLDRADRLLRQLVEGGSVPGLAVEASCQGEVILSAGYGLADRENGREVDPRHTVFRVASISKPITATALALLVEAGELGLDDPLAAYVPEYPQRHGQITLRQLASHTAGIRPYRGREAALNKPYSIADGLELFREDPLLFSPGRGYQYNSFDFVLLSLAMERAAGRPFHELVRDLVLAPLGMTQTHVETPGQPVPGQAAFYSRTRKGFRKAPPVDTRYKLAGGGYLSTVPDICRLGRAWLEEDFASPDTLDPFRTSLEIMGKPTYYGLGWQVSTDAGGRPFYGHSGNAVGACSQFHIYPGEELVCCVLVNCGGDRIRPALDEVFASICDATGTPDSPLAGSGT